MGTVTEIHDYLRLLYARAGTPHCRITACPLAADRQPDGGRRLQLPRTPA